MKKIVTFAPTVAASFSAEPRGVVPAAKLSM